jgi:hypothetical protein
MKRRRSTEESRTKIEASGEAENNLAQYSLKGNKWERPFIMENICKDWKWSKTVGDHSKHNPRDSEWSTSVIQHLQYLTKKFGEETEVDVCVSKESSFLGNVKDNQQMQLKLLDLLDLYFQNPNEGGENYKFYLCQCPIFERSAAFENKPLKKQNLEEANQTTPLDFLLSEIGIRTFARFVT